MYIFGFFKSLFRPRNFLASLYFLANLGLIYLIFGAMEMFSVSDTNNSLYNGLIGIGINFVLLFITMSPLGEAIWRYFNGVKLVEDPSDQELLNLYNEVYDRAKKVTPSIGDKVKLYFVRDNNPNAFALGRRTVVVTTGLLNGALDRWQIEAILAHEFGHIARRDSDIKLGITVNNIILLVFMMLLRLITAIIGGLFSRGNGKGAIGLLIDVVLLIVFRLWIALGNVLVAVTSRGMEYMADNYAVRLGYGKLLCNALNILDGSHGKRSFMALLNASHPATQDRIARMQEAMQPKQAA